MRVTFIARLTAAILAVAIVIGPFATAAAQERPASELEAAAGWVGFADDGIVSEGLVGGAARFYVSRRLSVGPELDYIQGSNHSHLMLTGNIAYDLLAPKNGHVARVRPFVVAGGGLFQTREQFTAATFTSSEGAFTAGGGVRASLGDRAFVGIDARVGWELHLRVNRLAGIRFGRTVRQSNRSPVRSRARVQRGPS